MDIEQRAGCECVARRDLPGRAGGDLHRHSVRPVARFAVAFGTDAIIVDARDSGENGVSGLAPAPKLGRVAEVRLGRFLNNELDPCVDVAPLQSECAGGIRPFHRQPRRLKNPQIAL